MKDISTLIQKEIMLEWKQRYAFNGLLMYVAATVFICYLAFRQVIDPPAWNALFWIILLFAGVNSVAKSFLQEAPGRQLYYYTLTSPASIILSKIIYNMMLMFVISLVTFLFYSLFIGNPVQSTGMFILGLLLGSAGFSSILTMVSAIASKAGGNASLMAILAFPILIPMLMTVIRFSKNAMDGLDASVNYSFALMLLGLNVLVAALAFLLFPYLWRD